MCAGLARMAEMEQIVSWVHDHMHAEADAGYPLLRRTPSTRATACFDYLDSLSPAERDELLEARARVAALGFVPSVPAQQEMLQLVNSTPALVNTARRWCGDRWPWAFVTRASSGAEASAA